ncbi:LytR/AlgR family response regulator transcription factor [Flavobacterium tegetincola]|uniref:LytR/AlgR family response regulator transcription factor n=1 Tax=Flavobacterium tegetincola TaxID=150172 RepID=UPI00041B7BC0|nr:LytTR family DNA-binding domain-containing protein [Flavobacterium tegetincola]
MYTTIIADDDIIQRTIIKKLIEDNYPRLQIVAEVGGATELIEASNNYRPHLLLLDINLGSDEIFDYLNQLETEPIIIFISSEKRFAVDAFRFNALDFIPKPLDKIVFDSAINKVLTKLDLDFSKSEAVINLNYLVIPSNQGYDIVNLEEVISITSEGRATLFVTTDDRKILSYKNLAQYEYLIYKYPLFIKISRSSVINFKFVKRIIRDSGMFCELTNGEIVPVSRRKTNDFKIFLNNLQ